MFRKLLASEFAPYGSLSDHQLAQLEQHYELLVKWNQKINLTRISALEDAVRLHYCESLFLARALPPAPLSIVDIGSGAGFPGIPIAILRSDCTVDLVESHQRKGVFLREVARDLPNVTVLPQRAETITRRYDWMVARAVRPADVVSTDLADRAALLVGREDAAQLGRDSSRRDVTAITVPWGSSRFLVMFHVERVGQPPIIDHVPPGT